MAGFDDYNVGDAIPETVRGPIARSDLVAFADASGDRNPIHLDDAEAQKGGLPGVIAHGMLNMAYLAQLLTGLAAQRDIRAFDARFVAMAFPGDTVTCRGEVVGKREEGGEPLLDLRIEAVNQTGERILTGSASVKATGRS